ncbi:Gfo/Idh/MocA family protein [Urechidicola croceus]|uniref:Oxidoreductase n=1 Tax=Urechidicola croceus TaxID=1850246 RepID=A0A1D8PAI8_9FLAO|nr:Gfo/Idh/MocA family oxidoreductase [Urechidicola croceus]AOW21541.1 oxidoreductase [Urechidicola croceus]
METKKIKWGIVGCGNIANKFSSDLALIEAAEITAVASRNIEKAQKFGKKHNSKTSYGSYDELFLDPDVDIVYIATPHVSHAELSIKAMEHGKHVLCEKPLALNAKEATAMIETSKRTNRFFMEALWTRFNPSIVAAKKHIDNGDLGKIKFINANFSFKFSQGLDSRTIALELGGGAILDIGIYPAFLTYLILGVPKDILAKSIFHEITKCDMQSSMIFNYDDAQAILYSSFESNSDMIARIDGTEGRIEIHKIWHLAEGYTLVKDTIEHKHSLPTNGIGFTYEIEECHKCLKNNQIESHMWSHQNSLDLISILDDVRQQVGLKYPQE